MYVVAYLIIFCNETVKTAMKNIENIMHKERHEAMDRHSTLYEIIVTIAEQLQCKYF
jgi:hypothetical protein